MAVKDHKVRVCMNIKEKLFKIFLERYLIWDSKTVELNLRFADKLTKKELN